MIGKSTNEEHCDLMADFINGIDPKRTFRGPDIRTCRGLFCRNPTACSALFWRPGSTPSPRQLGHQPRPRQPGFFFSPLSLLFLGLWPNCRRLRA
jgi:hypothetical protein